MLRAHLDARKRCYNHPHRESQVLCARCRVTYCDDCLSEYSGQLLCALCIREMEAIEAARPTTRQRVYDVLRSIRTTFIVLIVMGAIVVALFLLARPLFDRPITPEELARMRYAVSGTFETEEGINVHSTVLEAEVITWTSQQEGYPASNLINEFYLETFPGWRSTTADFPQEIIIQLRSPSAIEKTILVNHAGEPESSWVKDFALLVSIEGPDSGFETVGNWQMGPTAEPQTFLFDTTLARWTKLRILDNYGSPDYVSLAEFGAYVVPEMSMFSRQSNGTPSEQPAGP